MHESRNTLIELETKFWQSMIENDTELAVGMLTEPALMVSSHGTMRFDHAGYRHMANNGSQVLTSFEFSDMQVLFPDEKTAILAYRVKQGMAPRGKEDQSTEQEMYDTSTWIQSGGEWQCVMHTETPVQSSH
ncbi:MAG: nuclear transport factor 2 family protein [Steroidobacteraceae bacterium]